MPRKNDLSDLSAAVYLKPAEVKKLARVPHKTVTRWITVGHPRAGILPSIDLAENGKPHSYRILLRDWLAFQEKLRTVPRERRYSDPPPRPGPKKKSAGMFEY